MEVFGGLIVSLMLMVLLAGLGLATLAALALMMVLGLLTEMSFRRIFFVSFAMGLIAPIVLAGATYAAFEDGSLERDLRAELGEVITLPDDVGGTWGDTLTELQDIQREVEQGDITEDEAEARVKELFTGDNGVPLDLEDLVNADADEAVAIEGS
ncbi:MAG: hypothetical protein WBA51_01190 [Erythrobacter sp.]